MRYLIKVSDRKQTYYFYPSSYGNIMTNDPWKAISYSFMTVEGAEKFFNEEQESFKDLFRDCDILSVKVVGVWASLENVCNLV